MTKSKDIIGTSDKGDLQEAINNAVQKAIESTSGADILINWRLGEITGESGGLAGITKLTVKLSYHK